MTRIGLRSRGLWLHHLHRQFGTAARTEISKAVHDNDLVVCSVLSGNRNFEGRINPDVKANYLASPPLVVAYALAGTLKIDLTKDPIGEDSKLGANRSISRSFGRAPRGSPRSSARRSLPTCSTPATRDVFRGDERWREIGGAGSVTYGWDEESTYVREPPFFAGMTREPGEIADVEGARVLGLFADSITTDHISPAGAIKRDGPAGPLFDRKRRASP